MPEVERKLAVNEAAKNEDPDDVLAVCQDLGIDDPQDIDDVRHAVAVRQASEAVLKRREEKAAAEKTEQEKQRRKRYLFS
jgi:hypothetical protein